MKMLNASKAAAAISIGALGWMMSAPAANAGTIAFNFEYVDVTGYDASYLLNQLDPTTYKSVTPNVLAQGTIFVDGASGVSGATITTSGGTEAATSYTVQGVTGTLTTAGRFGYTGTLSLLPALSGVTNNQLLVSNSGSTFSGGQLVGTSGADAGVDGLGLGYRNSAGPAPIYDLYFDTYDKGVGPGIDTVTGLLLDGDPQPINTIVFWTMQGTSLSDVSGTPQEVLLAIGDGILVPEPVSIAVIGMGLLGISLVRRRRHSA